MSRPGPWLEPGKVHPEVERVVRAGVRDGLDDAAIGERLELSARTVKRVRHVLGELRAPSPAELVPDAVLVKLHKSGLTTREIGERAGLTYRSTQERLSRLGLRAHRARKPIDELRTETIPVRWTPAEVEQIRQLAAELEITESELVRRRTLGLG